MADDSRRRPGSPDNESFDWDAFDRKTSGEDSAAPRRRRRQSDIPHRSGASPRSAQNGSEPAGGALKKRGKKKRKKLSDKQRKFRKRFWLTILGIFLVLAVVGSGMCIGMYKAVEGEISEM